MKIKIVVWFFALGLFTPCQAKNPCPPSANFEQNTPQFKGVDLDVVINQVELLIKQGYSYQQIITCLQMISQPHGTNQHIIPMPVQEKDRTLEYIVALVLLGGAVYAVYILCLPYIAQQHEQAQAEVRKVKVQEVFDNIGRGANQLKDGVHGWFQNLW